MDAQGWGLAVTTCGFGGLTQGVTNENLFYTDSFNGTSSAAPMVAGALACVQGVLKAKNRRLLDPARARELLRTTGLPQEDGILPDGSPKPKSQRIGNLPDLREMIEKALATEPPLDLAQPVPGEGIKSSALMRINISDRVTV